MHSLDTYCPPRKKPSSSSAFIIDLRRRAVKKTPRETRSHTHRTSMVLRSYSTLSASPRSGGRRPVQVKSTASPPDGRSGSVYIRRGHPSGINRRDRREPSAARTVSVAAKINQSVEPGKQPAPVDQSSSVPPHPGHPPTGSRYRSRYPLPQ